MPRQETIKVIIDRTDANKSLQDLKNTAQTLKKEFGSIKIGDISKEIKAQASAAKEAANAAIAQSKAEKEAQNALIAKSKAEKEAANAETARSRQRIQAINEIISQSKAEKEAANAIAAKNKADKEASNAETARQRAIRATIQTQQAASRVEQQRVRSLQQLGRYVGMVTQEQGHSLEAMRQYITGFTGMDNAVVKATGALRNSQGTFQTYTATVANADGTLHKYRYAVDESTGAVYNLDKGISSASGSMANFSSAGKQAISFLKQLVGFYGVSQSLRQAFTEMKSMSDEMIVYQKVTKATADEMEAVRKQSYESAKKYGQTPTDFLSASSEMARAGYRENATAMADLAVKTKLVGDITAEEASKFLLAVDAGYKYQGNVEKLSSVLDMANEVGNNYATSIEKISGGMTLIASLAGQVGVPVEQLIAALGTMTAVTQRSGEEMARGLRSTFLAIMGDTTTEIEEGVTVTAEQVDSMTKALQHYAPEVVNAAKATGKLINPMEAIAALAKGYKEGLFSQEELFKISKDVAGQRYYNAFAALVENYDTMYQDMLEVERNAAGSADAEIAVLTNSWTTKLNQLKTTWTEMVNDSITEGFIKDLIDGATAALNFAGSLENLAMMAGGAVVAFKALKSAIKAYSAIRKAEEAGEAVSGFSRLGAGVSALTAGVSAAVAIAGAIKSAHEDYVRKLQEAAQQAVEEAQNEMQKSASLQDIIIRYEAVWADGTVEASEVEELQTLQEDLNTLLGDQATAIDLVNGGYNEMIRLLGDAKTAQEEVSQAAIDAAYQKAFAAFALTDLIKDPLVSGNHTGINFGRVSPFAAALSRAMLNVNGLTDYYGFKPNADGASLELAIFKPDTIEGMLDFYRATMEMIDYINGYRDESGKTLSEIDPNMYGNILYILDQMEENAKVAYALRESLNRRQNGIVEAAEEADDALGQMSDGAEEAAAAIETIGNATDRLMNSINNATNAKKAFDEAMKSTKADGMNAYISAYETLQKEINEGRVNSTAFYASARMLLGEEAFAATGGISANVLAAMNNVQEGAIASIADAYKIINQKYVDQNGTEIQGWGIYELLKLMPEYQGRLTDAQGHAYIPNMDEEAIAAISRAFSGLSSDVIIQWLNAFDQYDVNGATTSDVEEALRSGEEAAREGLDEVATASATAAQALNNLTRAAVRSNNTRESFLNGKWNGIDATGRDLTGTFFWNMYDTWANSPYNLIDPAYGTQGLQMQGFDIIKEFLDAGGDAAIALEHLGMTWSDISERFSRYGAPTCESETASWLQNWINDTMGIGGFTITLHADTDEAIDEVDDAVDEINNRSATIDVDAKVKPNGLASIGGIFGNLFSGVRLASGTSNFSGGAALVNDGAGPELIVDRGRAFVAGGGKPSIVALHKGAKVFTAGQTRNILDRSGIPAYADGTNNGGISTFFDVVTTSVNDILSSLFPQNITPAPSEDNSSSTNSSNNGNGGNDGNSGSTTDTESFNKLKDLIEYIFNRIEKALNEQIQIIDDQITALQDERERQKQQNELEEKQKAVADAQKDLQDALNDRTVRYLGEDGQWHWGADQRKVQSAQEALDQAKQDLADYEDEMAFNAQIQALEDQKQNMQDEFNDMKDTWQEILDAVNTPTGDIQELINNLLKNGSDTEKKAAEFIQKLLLNSAFPNGIFSGNYQEALTNIANAGHGNPIMPGEATATLASLIATPGTWAENSGDLSQMWSKSAGVTPGLGGGGGVYSYGGTNYNYYIDGMKLGADQMNRPLSEIMRDLTVYTNATVH